MPSMPSLPGYFSLPLATLKPGRYKLGLKGSDFGKALSSSWIKVSWPIEARFVYKTLCFTCPCCPVIILKMSSFLCHHPRWIYPGRTTYLSYAAASFGLSNADRRFLCQLTPIDRIRLHLDLFMYFYSPCFHPCPVWRPVSMSCCLVRRYHDGMLFEFLPG